MSCVYVTLYRVNADKFVFFGEKLQFGASVHHLSEIFIDDNMMFISLFSYGSPVVVRCMGVHNPPGQNLPGRNLPDKISPGQNPPTLGHNPPGCMSAV